MIMDEDSIVIGNTYDYEATSKEVNIVVRKNGNTYERFHKNGNNIGSSAMLRLSKLIRTNEYKEITFEDANLCNGMRHLSKVLENNTSLQIIAFFLMNIKSRQMYRLASGLKANQGIRKLILDKTRINQHGLRHLCRALKINRSIHEFAFKTGTEEQMQCLFWGLKDNLSIRKLDLSFVQFGNQGSHYVAQLLQKMASLTALNLMGNDIEEKGIQEIAEALKSNTLLQILSLRRNKKISGNIQCLMDVLKSHNTTLEVLNIEKTGIECEHMQGVEAMLAHNTCLRILQLGENKIRDSGMIKLCNTLASHVSLKNLRLNHTRIGDAASFHISEMLKRNTVLQVLALDDNEIGNLGLFHLSNSLKFNTTLQVLHLQDNTYDQASAQCLTDALSMNLSLTTLTTNYNVPAPAYLLFVNKHSHEHPMHVECKQALRLRYHHTLWKPNHSIHAQFPYTVQRQVVELLHCFHRREILGQLSLPSELQCMICGWLMDMYVLIDIDTIMGNMLCFNPVRSNSIQQVLNWLSIEPILKDTKRPPPMGGDNVGWFSWMG